MDPKCIALAEKLAAVTQVVRQSGSGGMTQMAAEMKALQDALPPALKPQGATLVAAYTKLADIAAKYGGDMSKAAADPAAQAAIAAVSDPAVQKAGEAISAYFDGGCKNG